MDGCVYPYRHIAAGRGSTRFDREPLAPGRRCDADRRVRQRRSSFRGAVSRSGARCWRAFRARDPRLLADEPALTARTCGLAAAAGIAPDRLLFLPQGRDDAENQARYELVDFVLDPMPYGGVNGTLEALDMGVPVVTLVGKRHGERTSYLDSRESGRHADGGAERPRVCRYRRAARRRSRLHARRARRDPHRACGIAADRHAGHTRKLEAAYLRALRLKAPAALDDAEPASG